MVLLPLVIDRFVRFVVLNQGKHVAIEQRHVPVLRPRKGNPITSADRINKNRTGTPPQLGGRRNSFLVVLGCLIPGADNTTIVTHYPLWRDVR